MDWVKRVTGISTPVGGISWSPKQNDPFDVPRFDGTLLLTSVGNDEIIEFLENHGAQITYLDVTVDACVATRDQETYVQRNNLDMDAIVAGDLSGRTFELRNQAGKLAYITFETLAGNKPKPSFGGTGTIQLFVRGFFEIVPTLHGGPSTTFHLKELEAPLEAKLKQGIANKSK